MEFEFALYRRNVFGIPTFWYGKYINDRKIIVYHGVVNGIVNAEEITTARNAQDELISRFAAKRKAGYKYLSEIRDSGTLPVEGDVVALRTWLDTYLPKERTTSEGALLPMLAKVYDDKVFKRCPAYIGQYKINGLRCFIRAKYNHGNLFKHFSLTFQSREGTFWNSLDNLEKYLLSVLNQRFLCEMVENNFILDGELYLPGYSVNQINHFIKDASCPQNKLIQYWCYDLAVEDTIQCNRLAILNNSIGMYSKSFNSKDEHFNNKDRFILLPSFDVTDEAQALFNRDRVIDLGFEGLILRNPNVEYDFGKRRVGIMVKYKKADDGVFKIVDIKPEGAKRSDIPLLVCKNDINDALFEVHLSSTLDKQREVLINKEQYIGKNLYIKFGERSGVNKVPFHVKDVIFV